MQETYPFTPDPGLNVMSSEPDWARDGDTSTEKKAQIAALEKRSGFIVLFVDCMA
jgi:hypothetical protein